MNDIDFLREPSDKRLRKEIKNICDSYSHPWDVLAELCQNSVDAIIIYNKTYGEMGKKDHKITINVDAKKRSLKIADTGIGFKSDNFAELLAPHGTDKSGEGDIIGEKGVGLTYTIFTSNFYQIKTKSIDADIEGNIRNAATWKNGLSDEHPFFNITKWDKNHNDCNETYTEIYLEDIEKVFQEKEDIFYQNINVLEYILRTKTAIGYLKDAFKEGGLNISINFIFNDIQGKIHEINFIHPKYMLPDNFITSSNIINLIEFKETAATLDDRQKARQLQGKSLIHIGSEQRAGRKINYYVFFAPSRKLWKDISEKNNIVTVDENGERYNLYESGIFVASKGMPTGIKIEPPIAGFSGYWPNFFMILEDDSIVFDLGRKSIPGRTKGMLREIAGSLFQEFVPYIKYVTVDPAVIGGTISTVQQYEKNKIFEELRQLPNLPQSVLDKISYLKNPDGQEAAIVALFHELIGSNILKGYYTLKTGYKQTYDLWGIYRIKMDMVGSKFKGLADVYGNIEIPLIIEYKFKAEDILKDFEDNIKYFIDVDLIVCWDLDEIKFAKQNVKVELLPKEEVFFFGSNYRLIWPGAYNLGTAGEKPVLALRKFIQDYSLQE
jgi:molecular chaperone HtpG